MSIRLASWLAAATLASGCSLIFNTDDLPARADGPPGQIDAGSPDAMLPDANPADLHIEGADPVDLDEGMGTGGGRPAVVALYVPNIILSATIEVTWADTMEVVVPDQVVISGTRRFVGLVLTLPIDSTNAEGTVRDLKVTISQVSVSDEILLHVHGHDELTLTGDLDTDSTTDLYDPTEKYSTVIVTGAVVAHGATPVVLQAFGGITINGDINASAVGLATTGRSGPHGCIGGAGTLPAPCQPAGGGAPAAGVLSGAGGGGGGYGSVGSPGGGGGGDGGDEAGQPMLVPIISTDPSAPGNRGHGGGGGGTTAIGGGGPGGNGGGVVMVSAGGDVSVGAGVQILANGTAGGNGGAGGEGGSGSGGAIMVRAGGTVDATGNWLKATPGAVNGNGGAGGNGRIRVDTSMGAVGAMGTPSPTLGPSWEMTAPVLVRSPVLTVNTRAQSGCYGFSPQASLVAATDSCTGSGSQAFDRLIGSSPTSVNYDFTSVTPGRQTLCAAWTTTGGATGTFDLPEAKSCIDVLFIPN